MVVLGVICCRKGSKGVPGKNTKLMCGLPLVQYTIQQAQASQVLDDIVVSTDDPAVVEIALYMGVRWLVRPPHLATDTASKWDVFRDIASKVNCDVLVDLDAGCPLRAVEDIDGCVRQLVKGNADVVVTAYESERNPYFNMVELWENRSAHLCIRLDEDEFDLPVYPRRQDAPKVWSLSPSVFAVRRDALDKFSHWSQSNMQIYEIPRERGIDIDTPLDWEITEYLMKKAK